MEINGLIIESVVVGSVGTNCYIVHKKDSEHCFVVDPGDSGDKIANYIRDQKMILDHILLTHGHFDHIQGVRDLKNAIRCEICALDVEKELLSDARMNVSAMTGRPEELEADCAMGEIVMKLSGKESDHSYSVRCAAGEVKIGDHTSSMLAIERYIDNGTGSEYSVDCSMGSISITFTGE